MLKPHTMEAMERVAKELDLNGNEKLRLQELAAKLEASATERWAGSQVQVGSGGRFEQATRVLSMALVAADNNPTIVEPPAARAAREAAEAAEVEAKSAAWRQKLTTGLDLRRQLARAESPDQATRLREELGKLEAE